MEERKDLLTEEEVDNYVNAKKNEIQKVHERKK